MTLVRFVSADGERVQEVDAPAGERLLDVAQAAGQPLEGTCEGQMACSTCHVIVAAEDFARLPRASEEEEDMLDLAAHVTRHSRLVLPDLADRGAGDADRAHPVAASTTCRGGERRFGSEARAERFFAAGRSAGSAAPKAGMRESGEGQDPQ